jgi:hypothetical protein
MIDTTLQAAEEPAVNDQTVTFTTTTQSAAFNASTRFITIVGSAAFHYAVGTNPTATTGALKIPADTPWTIAVTAGDKIAAVAAS